jgi:hypothetical protein
MGLIFYFLFSVTFAGAMGSASLFLFPTGGSYPIGEVFTISVNISTDEKISTAEGKINFNNEELEVVGVSKKDSILTSWDVEPSFSNEEGVIRFGGLTTIGYKGEKGKVIDISFKALKNKVSTVRFNTGAVVIAADKIGTNILTKNMGAVVTAIEETDTNILTSMDSGFYELTPKEIIPTDSPATTSPLMISFSDSSASSSVPVIPISPFEIISATHPDETRFYATTTAVFEWKWERTTSSVSFTFDDKPTTTPKKLYTSFITKKEYNKLSDGIFYFHIQRNETNDPSTLIHYRVGVDTKAPESFIITETPVIDAYGFTFDATDKGSGIEKYSIRVDEGGEVEWRDDGSHIYKAVGLIAGKHTLNVKAFDVAGNFIEQSFPFVVAVTQVPTFVEKIKNVIIGESLVLRFKTSPDSKVKVMYETDKGEKKEGEAIKVADGIFVFTVAEKAVKGTYTVRAVGITKGVESVPTEKITIISHGSIGYYAKVTFLFLKNEFVKILIGIFFIAILFYGWVKFKKRREVIEDSVEDQNESEISQKNKVLLPVNQGPKKIAVSQNSNNPFQVVIGKRQ